MLPGEDLNLHSRIQSPRSCQLDHRAPFQPIREFLDRPWGIPQKQPQHPVIVGCRGFIQKPQIGINHPLVCGESAFNITCFIFNYKRHYMLKGLCRVREFFFYLRQGQSCNFVVAVQQAHRSYPTLDKPCLIVQIICSHHLFKIWLVKEFHFFRLCVQDDVFRFVKIHFFKPVRIVGAVIMNTQKPRHCLLERIVPVRVHTSAILPLDPKHVIQVFIKFLWHDRHAVCTGLEPVTSAVTGRRSSRLN